MRRLFLLALICVSPAACAFFDDDDSPEPGTYVPVEEVASTTKDAACTYAARCGLFPDKAACLASNIPMDPMVDANVMAAIQAGKIAYDGRKVKKCLDALAATTCDQTDQDGRVSLAACTDFLRGIGKDGDPCVMYAECASKNCSITFPTSTCEIGECIGDTPPQPPVPARVGEPCFSSSDGCVAGAYCDFQQQTPVCAAFKTQGAACTSQEECAYGLACAGTTGATTCVQLPGLDQPCSSGMPCRDYGMYCDTSTTQPTCKKLGLPPATCTTSSQCSRYYPCDFSTGKCTKPPSIGQSCAATFTCFDAGTYCDTTTSLCTAGKVDGSACTSSEQCASHNCDMTLASPICTPPTTCS